MELIRETDLRHETTGQTSESKTKETRGSSISAHSLWEAGSLHTQTEAYLDTGLDPVRRENSPYDQNGCL